MKRLLLVIFAFFALSACNRQQDLAMKSADKDFILKVANEKFEKKKWKDAIALYERLSNLVAGTMTRQTWFTIQLMQIITTKTTNWRDISLRISQ